MGCLVRDGRSVFAPCGVNRSSRARVNASDRDSPCLCGGLAASSSTAGRLACFISTHPPTPCRQWEQSEIMLYVACVCGVFGMCSASGAGCGYVAPSQGSHSHASFPLAYLKANALKAGHMGVFRSTGSATHQRFSTLSPCLTLTKDNQRTELARFGDYQRE